MDSIISLSVSNPTPLAVRHVICWVIWVLKHILNNFFFYDFQKVTLFCCCPESSGVGLNTDEKTMDSMGPGGANMDNGNSQKKSIKIVFLAHFD